MNVNQTELCKVFGAVYLIITNLTLIHCVAVGLLFFFSVVLASSWRLMHKGMLSVLT
jgi:hypothetical protein